MLNIKSLPKNPMFQSGAATFVSVALLSWLHIRPIGLMFLMLFCFWLYKTRCNLRIVPPPDLEKSCHELMRRVAEWRQRKPNRFCAIATGCLGSLAIMGHLVSGSIIVLSGLVMAAIISTKYHFKIIKIQPNDYLWAEKINQDYEMEDEFMPDVNESNLFVLERACDLASITAATEDIDNEEDKSDEVPSELLLADTIPEIDDNSDTDDEHDDLLPLIKTTKSKLNKHGAPQTDESIEFKSGHFKRDSSLSTTSSSSEENLAKGLHFPDHTSVDGRPQIIFNPESSPDLLATTLKTQTQALLVNSSKLIPNLVSGLVQGILGANPSLATAEAMPSSSNKRLVTALDSSDESDFEILENEDIK
uniref:Protein with signal anchor n=1 Tax=Glossina palpalis gambiensis TaxID=67801 RepID=A0A1B0B8G1_9MUSC